MLSDEAFSVHIQKIIHIQKLIQRIRVHLISLELLNLDGPMSFDQRELDCEVARLKRDIRSLDEYVKRASK